VRVETSSWLTTESPRAAGGGFPGECVVTIKAPTVPLGSAVVEGAAGALP